MIRINEITTLKNEVKLKQWAEKIAPTVLPKTQLGKAFEYAFKIWEFLGNYFKNGDCAISNNAAENAIRPFTIGRKNWLLSDTHKGARASADIYSIVECIYRSDCHSCTDILPTLAADCPRALPGKI